MPKNKKWSSRAKFEIVLACLKGDKTIEEICHRYQVSASQVHAWKKLFLEQGSQLFDKQASKSATQAKEAQATQKRKLYETIGELTVERDFLKKSWEQYHGSDDEN